MPEGEVIRGLFERKQLENGVNRKIAAHIIEAFDDIAALMARRDLSEYRRKRELDRLIANVQRRIDTLGDDMHQTARKEIAEIGSYGSELAAKQIGVGLTRNTLTPTLMRAILDTDPIQGLHLRDWFAGASEATKRNVTRQIRLGISQDETIDQMVRRVRGRHTGKYRTIRLKDGTSRRHGVFQGGAMQATTTHAQAVVRTATTHIMNEAHFRTYSAHPDVTTEYEYVAVLDGRTSDICMGLSGQRFPYESDSPRPPQHVNCRSVIVPVIPGATEGISASESGPTAAGNYQEWLREQSPQRQNEILGPARAQMFRDGKLDLKQLVDREGRSRTVAELRGLTGSAEKVAAKTLDVPRFKTVKDAEAWIRGRYADEIAMTGATAEELQDVADGLHAVLGGRGVRVTRVEWAGRKGRFTGRLQHFDDGTTVMQLRKVAMKGGGKQHAATIKKNWAINRAQYEQTMERARPHRHRLPQELRERAESRERVFRETPRWSTLMDAERPSVACVAHEAGHALEWGADGVRSAWSSAIRGIPREPWRISEYATTNDQELWAEVTAMIATGRRAAVPGNILDVYDDIIAKFYRGGK